MPSSRESDPTPASSSLVSLRDEGALAAMASAISSARASTDSFGAVSLTRPIRTASAAGMRRALSSRSRACFSPTCLTSSTDTRAGTKPMRASV